MTHEPSPPSHKKAAASLNPDAPIFHYPIYETTTGEKNFHPYEHSSPDPTLHGDGPFVAALPARERVPPSPQLDQRPMWHPDAGRVGTMWFIWR